MGLPMTQLCQYILESWKRFLQMLLLLMRLLIELDHRYISETEKNYYKCHYYR